MRVEHGTGALTVGRRLSEADEGEYAVCVAASDRGHPAHSTRFNFTLVLDGARLNPYAAQSGAAAAAAAASGSHPAYAGMRARLAQHTIEYNIAQLVLVFFSLSFSPVLSICCLVTFSKRDSYSSLLPK